jgi:CheY-like chemotaxis protein
MSLVLIVEDEDALRVLAEPVIQHHGYEALSAGALEQAIALLEGDQKSDLLFNDLGLRDDLQAGLTAAQENSRAAGSLHHRPSAY